MLNNLVIFGGTFDPPHMGHIRTAIAVQSHMQFERFIFLPCKTPVLKHASTATTRQRIHMLNLALAPYPEFSIDLREIERDSPSYMVYTLQSFRTEYGNDVSLTLLLGMDAFLQLPQWHDWSSILKLCNLLVIKRGNGVHNITSEIKSLLKMHETFDNAELLNHPCGKIYQYNAGEYLISSSDLREKIAAGKEVSDCLSESVYEYINKAAIYTHKLNT